MLRAQASMRRCSKCSLGSVGVGREQTRKRERDTRVLFLFLLLHAISLTEPVEFCAVGL